MTDRFIDLSGKIDSAIVKVLLAFDGVAAAQNLSYFLAGATARDLLFMASGIRAYRRTQDVDLAIQVSSWTDFDRVVQTLIQEQGFEETRLKHRFSFHHCLIDIIPFGGVADQKMKIHWPPELEVIMSVSGFREAYSSSSLFRISKDPDLTIRVTGIPGLAIMKLVAWKDKYPERSRDAEDLFLLMDEYEHCGIEDRLYGEEQALLNAESYDNNLAGIRLLGRDMATLCEATTIAIVADILASEKDRYRLVADVVRNRRLFSERAEEISSKLMKLRDGFIEAL